MPKLLLQVVAGQTICTSVCAHPAWRTCWNRFVFDLQQTAVRGDRFSTQFILGFSANLKHRPNQICGRSGAHMAARLQACRGPTCAVDSPWHPTGASARTQRTRQLGDVARRSGKCCVAHPKLAVKCQAQQQQQQPATVDDAQRSRKLGRFSAKVGPCLTLQM